MNSFNVKKFYVLFTEHIFVLFMEHKTKNDYFFQQYDLVCFYNWDGLCLPRGRNWIFKYNSG